MKCTAISACLSISLLALAACDNTDEERRDDQRSRYGYHGQETQNPDMQAAQPDMATHAPDTTPAAPEPTPPPPPTSDATQPGQVPVKKDYPYGVKVPGKDGFVTSPFSPMSGYVDVRGFPPGTEVKDPYSGKIFLVP